MSEFSLTGKAAIVAGAGDGISRAIAQAFAVAGARVACLDIDGAKAAATAASLAGGRGLAVTCDVTDERATRAAVEQAVSVFGGLQVLVNGAAAADPTATVVECSLADWEKVFAVNVRGPFLLSKAAVPEMVRGGGGSIIHIASQMGRVGAPGRAVYCATKGALIQLAKVMAIDHAADGIRVNTLSPGAVETGRMLMRFPTMAAARRRAGAEACAGPSRSARGDRSGGRVPGQRCGELRDRLGSAGRWRLCRDLRRFRSASPTGSGSRPYRRSRSCRAARRGPARRPPWRRSARPRTAG